MTVFQMISDDIPCILCQTKLERSEGLPVSVVVDEKGVLRLVHRSCAVKRAHTDQALLELRKKRSASLGVGA